MLGLERKQTFATGSGLIPAGGRKRERALEAAADALLAGLPQDEEYPFRTEAQEERRRRGRGMDDQYREVPLNPVLRAPGSDPESIDRAWEQAEQVMTVAGLTRDQRICYLLHEWQGLPDHVIAQLLACSRRTVINRRQEAEAKLRQAVRELQEPTVS